MGGTLKNAAGRGLTDVQVGYQVTLYNSQIQI